MYGFVVFQPYWARRIGGKGRLLVMFVSTSAYSPLTVYPLELETDGVISRTQTLKGAFDMPPTRGFFWAFVRRVC